MSQHVYDEGGGYQEREAEGVSPATILFGLVLVSLGLLWLLDAAGVFSVTWTVVGSVMLVIIGLLLIAAARQDSHGGMIFLGVVLSGVVLLGSLASWPSFEGSVGDEQIAPTALTELEGEYALSVGNQEIDLTGLSFPDGETEVTVRLGTGNLEIDLPDDVAYRIEWSVGLGEALVLDEEHSGFGLDGEWVSEDIDEADAVLVMEIQLGLGTLEVRQ